MKFDNRYHINSMILLDNEDLIFLSIFDTKTQDESYFQPKVYKILIYRIKR